MTRLSVNINKVALIRNARGENQPNLLKVARDLEDFGAEGITVHPRPDERHIRYEDVRQLKPIVSTEFNVEGNPIDKFMDLVLETKPDQVTLVPDEPGALTSDHGWDTEKYKSFLQDVISDFKKAGIRTSIFLDANPDLIESAADSGTDRIELYTGPFAHVYKDVSKRKVLLNKHAETARQAKKAGLGVNAGHDLNLANLQDYASSVPHLLEVSIGHALISDSLYYGFENVIPMYLRLLEEKG